VYFSSAMAINNIAVHTVHDFVEIKPGADMRDFGAMLQAAARPT
jgi:hypothetical protein